MRWNPCTSTKFELWLTQPKYKTYWVQVGFQEEDWHSGNVITIKGILVTRVFKQIHSVNYDETFSPIVMLKSIQILHAIVAYNDYEIWKMNVNITFVNRNLLEDVCVT